MNEFIEMSKHQWECEDCFKTVSFRQPELPDDDPRSEMNGSKRCPKCGGAMYFDEVPEPKVAVTVKVAD